MIDSVRAAIRDVPKADFARITALAPELGELLKSLERFDRIEDQGFRVDQCFIRRAVAMTLLLGIQQRALAAVRSLLDNSTDGTIFDIEKDRETSRVDTANAESKMILKASAELKHALAQATLDFERSLAALSATDDPRRKFVLEKLGSSFKGS